VLCTRCLTRSAAPPQLNEQINETQQQAAMCAAGGALQPYNPTWAPWPTHAWPDAESNTCAQMQAHATYIQKSNQAQVTSIQANMNMQGC
jgi:hypothetical protein